MFLPELQTKLLSQHSYYLPTIKGPRAKRYYNFEAPYRTPSQEQRLHRFVKARKFKKKKKDSSGLLNLDLELWT
ncbi:hypothetical protein HYFRA_00014216 [Hymenoscyphus fraxineus]|uniref:Uncharacterized protein n=1 Tax=Hymenoscyphus fraxineus TaxID=746836 RepID=A0A9N9Q261_9HELO|nr:hypothetical protein HYFRA_00014216 [Hymenoscyphus fraxineus]